MVAYSCDKGSEEDIPSYIKAESIYLKVVDGQGTRSQKITDAWVYIDNEFIGVFELPFYKVPVLKAGKHQLKIYPGIKMNGIAATRVPYSFYIPYEKEINLVRGNIDTLKDLKTEYSSNTVFAWQEDFEQSTISLDTTKRSFSKLQRTTDVGKVFHQAGEYNSSSGIAVVSSDSGIFECVTHEAFTLPLNGNDVFMEMNYKTNNAVTVGLFVNTALKTIQEPLLVLNRNTEWNKIYINLTAAIVNHQDAINFKIFFGVVKESDVAEAEFLIDNIKLVHL